MLRLIFIKASDESIIKSYASSHQNIPRSSDEVCINGETHSVMKVVFDYDHECIYIYCN